MQTDPSELAPECALQERAPEGLEVHDGERHDEGTIPFQRIDARFIALSRFGAAGLFGVIGAGAIVGGCVILWVSPLAWLLPVLTIWGALAGWGVLNIVWWPTWEHARWSYRLGNDVIELKHGIVWHVAITIPLSRLQHVDLHQGPLERKWGLASLELHTAGTRDASHRIPGLDVAVAGELRDQLIETANKGKHEYSER